MISFADMTACGIHADTVSTVGGVVESWCVSTHHDSAASHVSLMHGV